MMDASQVIAFDNVSKFYGDVLGVNRVNLEIPPGITSLVGPNGSGKTTLMNLMTGLLRPSAGHLSVVGIGLDHPERLFREVGYCTQFDAFPKGCTGRQFIYSTLRLHGLSHAVAADKTDVALERVDLVDAADRRVAGYSKGMRQRIKLAQSIAHEPRILVLDEPLNGLDPEARAEVIELFQDWSADGLHLILSSHILHEVDMISDRMILIHGGYVIAEGPIREVRGEMEASFPLQIRIRTTDAGRLAAHLCQLEHVTEVKMLERRDGLLVRTRKAYAFYAALSEAISTLDLAVEEIAATDEDAHAVYQYLLGGAVEVAS